MWLAFYKKMELLIFFNFLIRIFFVLYVFLILLDCALFVCLF